jgi:hypothetical protein
MKKIFKITSGKRTLMYALTAFVILMAGCRGKEGPMGPTGNANVVSAKYTVNPQDWSANTNGGYTAILTVPEITSDIFNNGAILVYRIVDIIPYSFNLLPYTSVDNTSITYWDYDAFVGEIDLYYKTIDNGFNSTNVPGITMFFKVVIIEGMPLATVKEKVNITNFNAVASYFKLDNSKNLVK